MEKKMRMFIKTSIAGFVILAVGICFISHTASAAEKWVGTWATGEQLAESSNNPPSPYLANNTLRQIVRATVGGSKIRVHFSNKYTTTGGAVTINSAHIALSNSGYPLTSSIDTATDTALTFNNGSASVTIPTGQEIYSDAVDFNVAPLSNLAVSIYFGTASSTNVTGHPGSRTNSYIEPGNVVSTNWTPDGNKANWWILSRIDVLRDDSHGCVVTLGDSITDGRGCNNNYNNRWPDKLADKLQADANTVKVGVINQGIGGNCVYSGGLGPTALNRFDHDVLDQPGVRWVIVFEGTNDIGGNQSAANIISAYQTFINKAHANKILAYGGTITPFRGSGYYSASHEATRQTVNAWIRDPNHFDACLDFDAATWDPAAHDYLNPAYRVYPYPTGDQNDFLHFNPAGYQSMVNGIDANLFKLTADLDKDGIVNLVDFAILANQWQQAPGSPSADIVPMLAGDGIVNSKDLFLMTMEWLREE
jgi:lysophospholipase L1-like esterase